ncbi:hypothetical protein LINGRAHAP2_LOCUS1216 [Linum grandiflorum]
MGRKVTALSGADWTEPSQI